MLKNILALVLVAGCAENTTVVSEPPEDPCAILLRRGQMDKSEYMARLAEAQGGDLGLTGQLLDDADNNIGNATVVDPYPGFQQADFATVPQQNPARILNLNGLSKFGNQVTVALSASFHALNPPNQNVTGPNSEPWPIVGIIEFGNGSQFTTAEVDIPLGWIPNGSGNPSPNINQDGVTFVTVPAGTLRIYARNDSKLIEIPRQNVASQLPATAIFPDGVSGPGAPGVPNYFPPNASTTGEERVVLGAFVKASACYFGRGPGAMPTRTIPIANTVGATTFSASTMFWRIPPLARSFRIIRLGAGGVMPAITQIFTLSPNIATLASYSVAAGVPCPTFPLSGIENTISFEMTISGRVLIVYEIGL